MGSYLLLGNSQKLMVDTDFNFAHKNYIQVMSHQGFLSCDTILLRQIGLPLLCRIQFSVMRIWYCFSQSLFTDRLSNCHACFSCPLNVATAKRGSSSVIPGWCIDQRPNSQSLLCLLSQGNQIKLIFTLFCTAQSLNVFQRLLNYRSVSIVLDDISTSFSFIYLPRNSQFLLYLYLFTTLS